MSDQAANIVVIVGVDPVPCPGCGGHAAMLSGARRDILCATCAPASKSSKGEVAYARPSSPSRAAAKPRRAAEATLPMPPRLTERPGAPDTRD